MLAMTVLHSTIFQTKSKDYLSPNVKPGVSFGKKEMRIFIF
jgi:hypothetical protein